MNVKVKPLEWEVEGGWRHIGRPTARFADFCYWVMHQNRGYVVPTLKEVRPTLEEAKALAQADYEKRILSALEPAPKVTECDALLILNEDTITVSYETAEQARAAYDVIEAVVCGSPTPKVTEPVAVLSVFESAMCNGRRSGSIRGWDELIKKLPLGEYPLYTSPAPKVTEEAVERLVAAIEGELDGLSITKAQARTLLEYALEAAQGGEG
ncbi:hypothetical protein [Nitratireductor basaltis]|uniref:Uncharacterized protein n=1 Tax=Nitratireductor basaltis TaxID=472175 RepID=A0A084UDP5_9HYPH|nr:hypothetical protein [Nitratireductor basaltis]KFB11081.1 hypothetical protein EL18_02123 [Nitratireductor basaltis]